MLTKADDYPIHRTPEPIAYSGSRRNCYDRYFFNGYKKDGDLFFASELGVYPHLILHMDRLDTPVGPISVEVVEPLATLALRVDDPDSGILEQLVIGPYAPYGFEDLVDLAK